MAEQEMLLDSATIKAAVAGEKWATEKVIEHYAPMIDELAVDEDMKQLRKRTASQSKKITLYEDETLRAAIRYPGARKNKQVEQSNNL